MADLKPIDPSCHNDPVLIRQHERLHRLFTRLKDTHIDDLTEERIEALERIVDDWRITHANGKRLGSIDHG